MTDREWMTEASCTQTDPDLFSPIPGQSSRPAIAICRECPVRDICLKYALDNDENHGVWGGMEPRERKLLKRRIARRVA